MLSLAGRLVGVGIIALGTAALGAQDPPASLKQPATLTAQAPAKFRVQFDTSKGAFVVEVTRDWAPLGADRFYNLVKHGYYSDNRFYRVIPETIAQFGFTGDAEINAIWYDATIPDDPRKQMNERGYVSFAASGPNKRTTQIVVNLTDNRVLDQAGFVPFGRVVSGMNVLDKVHSGYGEVAPNGKGPDQLKLATQGNAYLAKDFPKLDFIKTATLVEPAAKD